LATSSGIDPNYYKDLKMKNVTLGNVSEAVEVQLGIEVELSELELAYVGGGIGDVVGH
jgi:hypothetical protein